MGIARALALVALVACSSKSDKPAKATPQTVRVAVIGGMMESGFWEEVATRFEQASGHKVELASSGPKHVVIGDFRKGGIDLITMHSSDAIVNLVADGLASDPQPWVQNDLVIVGPTTDPAGIKDEKDAATALKKLVATNAKFVVHASLGADGVMHDLETAAGVKITEANLVAFGGGNQREILDRAAEAGAYTMVGRIPVLLGKLKHDGIEIMVRGDGRLRRPYLVAIAKREGDQARIAAARELAEFLRSKPTQDFIATFGKGKYDDASLFFPIVLR